MKASQLLLKTIAVTIAVIMCSKMLCYACYTRRHATKEIPPKYVDVDGQWSSWGPWGSCSKTCYITKIDGQGQKPRVRKCDSPPQMGRGNECEGAMTDMMNCESVTKCPPPIHGGWGAWGSWTACTLTCQPANEEVYKYRSRGCNNPVPKHGGNRCGNTSFETINCHLAKCPVDGGWSSWFMTDGCKPLDGSSCSAGEHKLKRSCNNPTAVAPGKLCEGGSEKNLKCWYTNGCPVGVIGPVNITYFRKDDKLTFFWRRAPYGRLISRFSIFYRLASNKGGKATEIVVPLQELYIYGEQYSYTFTNLIKGNIYDFWMTSLGNDKKTSSERTDLISLLIGETDGNWGNWGFWSSCSSTCFMTYGRQTRKRLCSNPIPSKGGNPCQGESIDVYHCTGMSMSC